MWAASDRFLREIATSHEVYSYVDVVGPNLEEQRLQCTGGQVTLDVTAQVRRYGNLLFTDDTGEFEALLVQPGVELKPFRGVRYSDGTVEVAPMGVLRISTIDLFDDSGGSRDIIVECYDRSRTVMRDSFTVPYVIPEGTNLLVAIKDILARTFAGLDYDAMSTQIVTSAPKIYDSSIDPWTACADLAMSMGCEIFFDSVGNVVVAPPVDIDALPTPSFRYAEGKGCTMLNLEKKYTDDPGYNGIVLIGESVGDEQAPVMSIQWDEEPTSFTYHLGPYGEVPLFITDQNVKTQQDADNAATAWLRQLLGFASQITLIALLNAALDAGDVVEIVRERSNVSGLYTIDGMIMPMKASETATITLRQKRTR